MMLIELISTLATSGAQWRDADEDALGKVLRPDAVQYANDSYVRSIKVLTRAPVPLSEHLIPLCLVGAALLDGQKANPTGEFFVQGERPWGCALDAFARYQEQANLVIHSIKNPGESDDYHIGFAIGFLRAAERIAWWIENDDERGVVVAKPLHPLLASSVPVWACKLGLVRLERLPEVYLTVDAQGDAPIDVAPIQELTRAPEKRLSSRKPIRRLKIDEASAMTRLIDDFNSSPYRVPQSPKLTITAVRIFLHEMGLTLSSTVCDLRAALGRLSPNADLHFRVAARSARYGLTANLGRRFNAADATAAFCDALLHERRHQSLARYTPLTSRQQHDRERRWRAWCEYLRSLKLSAGPLPSFQW